MTMPTEAEWLAIGQFFTLLAALLAYLQSRRNAVKQKENNDASRAAIQEIHLTVNSRLTEFKDQTDKLLAASIAAAHAKGMQEARNRSADS